MNTEFKGTKGKWQYETIESGVGLFHCIVQKRNSRIVTYVMNDYPEFIENAKLIADAGNTIQSCGLLPSELLKQRDELKHRIELYKECFAEFIPLDRYDEATAFLSANDGLAKELLRKGI